MHILVVEDDQKSGEVVARMLEYRDMMVDIAQDAHEAWEMLSQRDYHAAVIDLALPEIDGWGLLQSIQEHESLSHLPCVAITAYHDRRVEQEALQAGFMAYFPKPLRTSFPDEVIAMLS
ncbi:MAG: response regulator [Chloroflexi bacterium]|nr:MAG: response regulator [Chloroflexota bacterium]